MHGTAHTGSSTSPLGVESSVRRAEHEIRGDAPIPGREDDCCGIATQRILDALLSVSSTPAALPDADGAEISSRRFGSRQAGAFTSRAGIHRVARGDVARIGARWRIAEGVRIALLPLLARPRRDVAVLTAGQSSMPVLIGGGEVDFIRWRCGSLSVKGWAPSSRCLVGSPFSRTTRCSIVRGADWSRPSPLQASETDLSHRHRSDHRLSVLAGTPLLGAPTSEFRPGSWRPRGRRPGAVLRGGRRW